MYCSFFSKGIISLRTPCALYLVVVVVPRETVRFEDEEDFKKEIWLKVFSRILKKRQPWKHCFTFFSPEKLTRLFLWTEVQPSPDRHKMIKLPTLITCSRLYDILAKTRGGMTTATAFSRQNDAGSRVRTTGCWENLSRSRRRVRKV